MLLLPPKLRLAPFDGGVNSLAEILGGEKPATDFAADFTGVFPIPTADLVRVTKADVYRAWTISADSIRNLGGALHRDRRDFGDESKAARVLRTELATGQAEIDCSSLTYCMFDGAEDKHGPVANSHLRQPKAGFRMRHHNVSVGCQTGAALENRAVDSGDNRLVDALNRTEETLVSSPELNLIGFELFSEIHANNELGAIGREHNRADRPVAFYAIKGFQ
jgi:hypothetical protein